MNIRQYKTSFKIVLVKNYEIILFFFFFLAHHKKGVSEGFLYSLQNVEAKDGTQSATLQEHILSSLLLCLWPFVYSLLTTSPHSLSLSAHAICPLHPLSTTLLLCVPFTLCLDIGVCVYVCVHAWLRESSEDRG